MKRVISILMILAIMGTVFSVLAAGLTSGSFTYTVSGSNATITDWSGSGSVTVPATITNGSTTYKVTKIGSYAFADKSITSVTFSGTNLTEIGEGAFSTNPGLTRITIPVNVTAIKARAFHSCVNLQSLSFADNCKLKTIGQYAFRNCQSLMNFTFPSGVTTIEKFAFSYCTFLSQVSFPQSVTSVGEEAFLGCLNLGNATFYNQNTAIGDNAFDLTLTTNNVRRLKIISYYTTNSNTTAKAFATREGFSHTEKVLTQDGDNVVLETPSAGSYYVRVTFSHNGSVGTFNKGIGEECNDSCGVIVRYKTNNGTGSTNNSNYVYWSGSGSPSSSKSIGGFPDMVYLYFDENRMAGRSAVYAHLTKLEVSGNNSTWTTLWSGDLQVGSVYNPYAISIDSSGTIKKDYFGTDKECKAITPGSGWSGKFPTPSSITDMSDGVTSMEVNTDGSTNTAPVGFTPGTVKDQYGVQMSRLPTLSVSSSSGGTTGISINDYRKIVLTSAANRANNYSLTVSQSCGSYTATKTKTVNVSTFDYNVTYSYYDGNTPMSIIRTVNYGGTAAVPMSNAAMPSKFENADGHYPFSSWDTLPSTTYTSGPQNVQVNAQYESLTAHTYTEEVTAPTCYEYGNTHHTCDCGFIIYDSYTSPTHHNNFTNPAEYTTEAIPPSDGHAGATVYKCTLCNKGYCTKKIENGVAVPDVETGTYINVQDVYEAIDGLPQKAEVPAPAFNNFAITYDSGSVVGEFPYQSRLSQLKVENDNATYVDKNTTQALRFAGAVTVPEGVSTAVGSTTISDNVVTDFGFVYTQDRYITGPSALVIGGKTDDTSVNGKTYDIAKYSVKDANNGVFDGSNWSGVTLRNNNGTNTLTFNLLIAVYAKNWNRAYAARPYLTYRYNGVEYTIYDQGTTVGATGRTYSCASVAYIATIATNNIFEPESTRTYLQNKVVNHLSEQGGYVANPTV